MNSDLNVALKAARKGVETIKSYRNKKLNTREKGFHDLVTDADIATEKEILSVIREHCPDDSILAEETLATHSLTDNRTWIVDPIDGTTNFAHDFPIYCVSVALWEHRQPKTAVVIEVNRNEEFTAEAGLGAFLNGKAIQVSATDNPRDAFIATGFPYNDLSLIDSYLKLFRLFMDELQGIRRPGAATYDLCCVAAGRFDGFFEYSLQPWDVAAASLIIKEAGGAVTNWMGEDNWLFGERLVAGNNRIHQHLLKRIIEYIPPEFRQNVDIAS
ncbi:inositol monophosphatase family protein [Rhodohalobacter mucosus]|uniref:Inositol-1-monophosphatase n=1 Tax=Rhodohalobacter mucosus TaxID=2079485 RepID=A0A316TSL4_9BACT|nr:inositol monophosphatase family protein [Rhodohalobacter mucosus]PWN07613.1 inositol monophosphatase [Rhodohalobacter mucosus]